MKGGSARYSFWQQSRHGLTLVELCITLVIVALLIGLTLPVLISTRNSARVTACAMQQRQQVSVLVMYASSNRDLFPYSLSPSGEHSWVKGRTIDFSDPYAVNGYTVAAANPWEAVRKSLGTQATGSLVCPMDRDTTAARASREEDARTAGHDVSSYEMSSALLIAPQALNADRPRWERQSLVPQRWSSLSYPSQKAVAFDSAPFHDGNYLKSKPIATPPWHTVVAAADGAASLRNTADCRPAVVFAPFHGTKLQESTARIFVFRFTEDGVRGRDW